MNQDDILFLKGDEIITLFKNRDQEILQAVKSAYQIHAQGDSCLPHSNFLRFPNNEKDRIIALPAYLGGGVNTAGIKWIASFPGNLALGMERASAVLILNSAQTGHAQAIMESSVISAKRTAASAAIAAQSLRGQQTVTTLGLIGTGLINFETVRFLLTTCPNIKTLLIYDLSLERAEQFKFKCQQLSNRLEIAIVSDEHAIFENSEVISFATTATKPHISDIYKCRPGTIILHISLRDLAPSVILSADNIVDDVDHVSRAQTSIHLAEQQVGNRDFIRATIGDILNGVVPSRPDNSKIAIFSPFGLGVLDLALGQLAYKLAREQNQGTTIESFLPIPWLEREE
ncbi:delta(1)-pyrroline-2-carboxylate reductase [Calothrix sp. NIES-4071]|nr:delta(1)-pyrroline-2-carboxylate reductase [Calothrix sp. NIES-4071]BAZ60469.1 delta(1)-pyrroline-2-carboxylate reductase [Calothrix sp. NIES-4105]